MNLPINVTQNELLEILLNIAPVHPVFIWGAPILIITDGYIEEHIDITHSHAFLIPEGNRLPFRAKGEVFYYKE